VPSLRRSRDGAGAPPRPPERAHLDHRHEQRPGAPV